MRRTKKVFRLSEGGVLKGRGIGKVNVPRNSIVRISAASAVMRIKKRNEKKTGTKGGETKMPPKRRIKAKKKAQKKPRPLFSTAGQTGTGVVEGSKYRIERRPDVFKIKKPPKKPKVEYV